MTLSIMQFVYDFAVHVITHIIPMGKAYFTAMRDNRYNMHGVRGCLMQIMVLMSITLIVGLSLVIA